MLIAATNRADNLDPALLRPGRFDRRLTFEVPDRNGRRELVDHFLARKAHDSDLDDPTTRDAISAVTSGFTPAMLEGMFDEALINAVRFGRDKMSRQDTETARLTMTVGMGQPKAYTEHERTIIATHEAGHTTVAWLVAPHRRLEVLSIVKRRDSLGLLAHGDPEDVYTRSRAELSDLMKIAMGGQVAEVLFFDDMTTGPGGDLLYATNVAAHDGRCQRHDRHPHLLHGRPEQRLQRHQHRRPGAGRRRRASSGSSGCCRSSARRSRGCSRATCTWSSPCATR